MAERVEIGDAILYLGDCLEVLQSLKQNSIDAVITDPPYSSGGQFRGDRAMKTSDKYVQTSVKVVRPEFAGDNRDQRGFQFWSTLWASAALRATKPGGVACFFSDWRQLPVSTDYLQAGGWVWRGLVPWNKTGSCRPAKGRFAAQCEYVVWGSAGALPIERGVGCLPGFFSYSVEKDKQHITQKPQNLMADVCEICPLGGGGVGSLHGVGFHGGGRDHAGSQIHRHRGRTGILRHCVHAHRGGACSGPVGDMIHA